MSRNLNLMKVYRVKDAVTPWLAQFFTTKAAATKEAKLRTAMTKKEHEVEALEVPSSKGGLRRFCESLWEDALVEYDKVHFPSTRLRTTAEKLREDT
tara:strand:- start:72 stop:362 length:291 start_codon:yes stop_codon:yes gene_type:complete